MRIQTTHAGSLPRPESLVPLLRARHRKEPIDEATWEIWRGRLADWLGDFSLQTEPAYNALEETGQGAGQIHFPALGAALDLNGAKLERIAKGWLPKPVDLGMMLHHALDAGNSFGSMAELQKVQELGAFHPGLSLFTSLLFAVGMIVVAARQLAATDY